MSKRAERFASYSPRAIASAERRLLKHIEVDTSTGCWLWTGAVNEKGYGWTSIANTSEKAHVVSMFLRHGAAAMAAETVNHFRGCSRRCCNPDHLQFASNRENVLHGNGLTAVNFAKTACIRGHPFDTENTDRKTNGARACSTCRAAHQAARRLRTPRRPRVNPRWTGPNINTKLSHEKAREIRARCLNGEPQASIAASYGVTKALISQVHRNLIWRQP